MTARAVLACLVLAAIGCGGRESNESELVPATIRLIHLCPDADGLDLYVAGSSRPLVSGLRFGEAGARIEVPAGEVTIELRAAGAAADAAPLFSQGPLEVPEGAEATVLAAGLLGSKLGSDRLRLIPLLERFEEGGARLRFVHAVPDAPALMLELGAGTGAEIGPIAPFGDSGEPGLRIPAGAPLRVPISTAFPSSPVATFELPGLAEGETGLAILAGLSSRQPGEPGNLVLLLVRSSGEVVRIFRER